MVFKRAISTSGINEILRNSRRKSAAFYTKVDAYLHMKDHPRSKRSVENNTSEILDALGSSDDVRTMSSKMVKIADKYGTLVSNNPRGEAAGIVYIAGILTDHPVSLAVIAEIAGISSATVRKYKTHLASELKTKKEWPGLPPKGK